MKTLYLGAALALGFLFAAFLDNLLRPAIDIEAALLIPSETAVEKSLGKTEKSSTRLSQAAYNLDNSVKAVIVANEQISEQISQLAIQAKSHKNFSIEAYEDIIVKRLGKAVYKSEGENSSIMIFELNKEDMRGYMAKIKLKTPDALRFTINPDAYPYGETTEQAARRNDAIFAINGGGFATSTTNGVAKLAPIGNTMIEGKLVNKFTPPDKNLAFIGLTKSNRLVGGKYKTKKELKSSGAWQGVTFVPSLIKDWEPLTIPAGWSVTRQPRTVLGQYPNGDLFFIVVDGRQSNWSNGITLEEIQVLLLRLGVMEAYNLDGGGSSVMFYKGAVLNKPSDGQQRRLTTNLIVYK